MTYKVEMLTGSLMPCFEANLACLPPLGANAAQTVCQMCSQLCNRIGT